MPSPSDVPEILCTSPLVVTTDPLNEPTSKELIDGIVREDSEIIIEPPAESLEDYVPGPFEPPLIHAIIEHYEGDMEKNVYHGRGLAKFRGGAVYQGNFKEGRMHGHGSYTWPDGTLYEGDFEENNIQGDGKYSWPDGSTYQGKLVNGLRDGYGVFLTGSEGECRRYEGEWLQGKRQGKGKMYYNNEGNCYYLGEWVSNLRCGQGEFHYPSGSLYRGEWLNNKKHGFGHMYWEPSKDRYVGQWMNGSPHGHGEYTWVSDTKFFTMCNRYKGEWKDGKRHGRGSYFYASGAFYEGHWSENMKHGEGTLVFENGTVFSGEFQQNRMVNYDRQPTSNEFGMPKDLEDIISNPSVFAAVKNVLLRHISDLRKLYNYYSQHNLASDELVFTMTRMDFWKLMKDCHVTFTEFTLVDIDRIIAKIYEHKLHLPIFQNPHEPTYSILQRDFFTWLVRIADVRFQHLPNIVDRVSQLLSSHLQVRCRSIFPHSAAPKSEAASRSSTPSMMSTPLSDIQPLQPVSVVDIYHAEVKESVKSYLNSLWTFYKKKSTKKEKSLVHSDSDLSMTQRDLLMILKVFSREIIFFLFFSCYFRFMRVF
eukprot:TRINITY_DN6545_c0_g1_i3.p1 TRINITY_DN6545_c0_g1~~TRINITY_DN6545_c0_g1_i3.p1  ORF type:complete len:591 (+),score=98.79 TRINITY_DN6545_c0_g1_i3:47-1819(+)